MEPGKILTIIVMSTFLSSCFYKNDKITGTDIKNIGELINDLSAPEYTIRERAKTELFKIGETAKEQLKRAADSTNTELSENAKEVLAKIEQYQKNTIDKNSTGLKNTLVTVISELPSELIRQFPIIKKNESDGHGVIKISRSGSISFQLNMQVTTKAHSAKNYHEFKENYPEIYKKRKDFVEEKVESFSKSFNRDDLLNSQLPKGLTLRGEFVSDRGHKESEFIIKQGECIFYEYNSVNTISTEVTQLEELRKLNQSVFDTYIKRDEYLIPFLSDVTRGFHVKDNEHYNSHKVTRSGWPNVKNNLPTEFVSIQSYFDGKIVLSISTKPVTTIHKITTLEDFITDPALAQTARDLIYWYLETDSFEPRPDSVAIDNYAKAAIEGDKIGIKLEKEGENFTLAVTEFESNKNLVFNNLQSFKEQQPDYFIKYAKLPRFRGTFSIAYQVKYE